MKSKISYKAFWAFVSWSDSVTRQLRNRLFWHQKHPKFTGENHHLFEPKKRKSNSVKSGHSVAFRKNPEYSKWNIEGWRLYIALYTKKIYLKWLAFNVTGNAILVKTDTFLKTYINVNIFKEINFYNISRNSLAKNACLKCCFKTLWPISKT